MYGYVTGAAASDDEKVAERPIENGVAYTTAKGISQGNECGQYIVPGGKFADSDVGDSVQSAHADALDTALSTAESLLTPYLNKDKPNFIGDAPETPDSAEDIINEVAEAYQNALNDSFSDSMSDGVNQLPVDSSSWTSLGWIGAGAYFNNIAKGQGDLEAAARSSIPKITGPQIEKDIVPWGKISIGIVKLGFWLDSAKIGQVANDTYTPGACDSKNGGSFNDAMKIADKSTKEIKEEIQKGNIHVIDLMAALADATASINCVWSPSSTTDINGKTVPFTLGITLTSHPYLELISLGYHNLNVAYELLDDIVLLNLTEAGATVVLNAAGHIPLLNKLTSPTKGVTQAAAGVASTFLGILAGMFFSAGFTLAYFLPLIPFITFLTQALTWIIMVLEAVIMIPLVAIAHLNIEGDGLPGKNAEKAYYYILDTMLYPVLMIFGLVCAWLVFNSGIILMNKMYMVAVSSAISIGGGAHVLVSRLIFSGMYVFIAYVICHKSFDMIGTLPEHAMAWIGANSAPKQSMGRAADSLGMVNYAGVLVGQQLLPQVGNQAQQLVKLADGITTPTRKP